MSQDMKWKEQSSKDFIVPKPEECRPTPYPLPPPIKSTLGIYKLLSPTASVRVSPLCLGTMSVGNQWPTYMGNPVDQAGAEKYLDAFVGEGGNFIDTANHYQDEQTEHILGEWMEKRGIRDDLVIATKYSLLDKVRPVGESYPGFPVNHAGNSKKSLRVSLNDSLRRLRTDYVDILYVHYWDHTASIPELMQSLNDVVKAGKVLYLGISDTPAWVVSKANEYARQNALQQFVVYQGKWSVTNRDIERDIIPMCRHEGMALVNFGALGQGLFKTPDQLKTSPRYRGGIPISEQDYKAAAALTEVAEEIGNDCQPAQVALAWCRTMMSDCWPLMGGTDVEHLKANIKSLDIKLTEEQIAKIDAISPFNPGYPTALLGVDPRQLPGGRADTFIQNGIAPLKLTPWPRG